MHKVGKMKFWIFTLVNALILEDSSQQIINLQYWMTNLPTQLKDVPLIYLAIPGSHNSMTYGINKQSKIGPDAERTIRSLYPVWPGLIRRWSITQSLDASQQLHQGIRYFDLRVATKNHTKDFYFTHGLYAENIDKPFAQIRDFVDSHPGEVVILDFQHFYGIDIGDHERLTRVIVGAFGRRLAEKKRNLEMITLNSLGNLKQQVIIIYRAMVSPDYAWTWFWESFLMPTPWPEKTTVSGLMEYLQGVKRVPGKGFVHQAVLTPTGGFLALRFLSSLREQCAVPVKNKGVPILRKFAPGLPAPPGRTGLWVAHDRIDSWAPVNVVIADFIELDDAIFPRTIIEINMKLLTNTTTRPLK